MGATQGEFQKGILPLKFRKKIRRIDGLSRANHKNGSFVWVIGLDCLFLHSFTSHFLFLEGCMLRIQIGNSSCVSNEHLSLCLSRDDHHLWLFNIGSSSRRKRRRRDVCARMYTFVTLFLSYSIFSHYSKCVQKKNQIAFAYTARIIWVSKNACGLTKMEKRLLAQ